MRQIWLGPARSGGLRWRHPEERKNRSAFGGRSGSLLGLSPLLVAIDPVAEQMAVPWRVRLVQPRLMISPPPMPLAGCAAIQASTSDRRHATRCTPSRTGRGNVPAVIRR